jgi:AcrR family transcriptional regulator
MGNPPLCHQTAMPPKTGLTIVTACRIMNSVQLMATARQQRLKRELREEILGAARELFVQEGYANVNMRAIAEKVGCAPGTIYLHFEDKGAILSSLCVETFAKLDRHMEAIADDHDDPMERLRRGLRRYIQFGLDHPEHYIVTFGVSPTVSFKDDAAKQAGLKSFECMRTCVGLCIDAGQTKGSDRDEIAQALWACAHGIVMLLITKAGFPFVEQSRLVERVVDIAIEGIRK